MAGEVWKAIPGYEGSHEVSNLGRVRTIEREYIGRGKRTSKPKVIAQWGTTWGYLATRLNVGGKKTNRVVHRLVVEAFHGPAPSASHMVNHKDGNKLNNCADNLEWCTASENANHAFGAGLLNPRRGEGNGNSVLTEDNVRAIRRMRNDGATHYEIADAFGVSRHAIAQILKGATWRHVD